MTGFFVGFFFGWVVTSLLRNYEGGKTMIKVTLATIGLILVLLSLRISYLHPEHVVLWVGLDGIGITLIVIAWMWNRPQKDAEDD